MRHRLDCRSVRCPIIGSLPPPKKSLPGRQFTGNNPPRPAAAQAGRIFTGKLSAGGRLFFLGGGDPIVGRLFMQRRYFNKGETYQIRDYLSQGGFFMGETF